MNKDEFKLRICTKTNSLIDQYFTRETVFERFVNATLKVIVKKNVNKVDTVISLFQDEDGNINAEEIVREYAEEMGETGFAINIRDYIKDTSIKNMLPDRTLTITKDDLYDIVSETTGLE